MFLFRRIGRSFVRIMASKSTYLENRQLRERQQLRFSYNMQLSVLITTEKWVDVKGLNSATNWPQLAINANSGEILPHPALLRRKDFIRMVELAKNE